MRRTTILLATACLLASTAVGCSKSDNVADCATALTERTGGDSADTPTVKEAEERVDAFDKTLAAMVRSGYDGVAKKAYDAADKKMKAGGEDRPEACGPLSEDDYTALLTAKTIGGLGWTGKDGQFDKLKMVESLGG